jgi:hypothetical protein
VGQFGAGYPPGAVELTDGRAPARHPDGLGPARVPQVEGECRRRAPVVRIGGQPAADDGEQLRRRIRRELPQIR